MIRRWIFNEKCNTVKSIRFTKYGNNFYRTCKGRGRNKREAILENDFENTIEEFHDVIQAMLSAYHLAGYDVKELIKGQEGHFEKLKNRGWKFKNE